MRILHKSIVAMSAGLALAASPAHAQSQSEELTTATQAAEEEQEPLTAVLSRTTISVRSIEESLKFYQGILGLEPFYKREKLDDPRLVGFSGIKEGQTISLVALRPPLARANDIKVGHLGLIEIREADGSLAQAPEPLREPNRPGSMAFLIFVSDVLDIHEKVVAAGYEIIAAPVEREGQRPTQLLMRGPDGERLWIGQNESPGDFLGN